MHFRNVLTGPKESDEVRNKSGYESLFREWGNGVGNAVGNRHITFIFIVRESLGATKTNKFSVVGSLEALYLKGAVDVWLLSSVGPRRLPRVVKHRTFSRTPCGDRAPATTVAIP